MQPKPLYSARNLHPSYRLYYEWSGWPSVGLLPAVPKDAVWDALAASWEPDGLRLLERRWDRDCVHLTFSTTPTVSPVFLAQRRVWEDTYYAGTFGEYDLKVVRGAPSGCGNSGVC